MPKHAALLCIKCYHPYGSADETGLCRFKQEMDGLVTDCFCECEYVREPRPVGELVDVPPLEELRAGTLGEVIDRRVQVYGDPEKTFVRIAEVWSGILGTTVNPVDVPLCMIGLKLVRAQVMPDYEDNIADVEGYADIFRTLVGDDMVKVRSVAEFIQQKWGE